MSPLMQRHTNTRGEDALSRSWTLSLRPLRMGLFFPGNRLWKTCFKAWRRCCGFQGTSPVMLEERYVDVLSINDVDKQPRTLLGSWSSSALCVNILAVHTSMKPECP